MVLEGFALLAKIFLIKNEYHLCLCNNKPKKLALPELRDFLETFNDKSHYPTDDIDNEYGVLSPANGELLAEVSDDLKLTVASPKLFFDLFHAKEIRYLTLDEYAELVGRGRNIVGRMCRNGRIPGARQQGARWLIPEDAPYPQEGRKR